jgi:plasmid stabilization system protein ParE
MRTIVFLEGAQEHYREAIRYYFDITPNLAMEFRAEIERCFDLILSDPESNDKQDHKGRCLSLDRFGIFYIAYTLWRRQIVIVAIGHSRRSPHYWLDTPPTADEIGGA